MARAAGSESLLTRSSGPTERLRGEEPSIIGGDNCSGSQWGPARCAPFGLHKNEHSLSGHLSNLAGSLLLYSFCFSQGNFLLMKTNTKRRVTWQISTESECRIRSVKNLGGAEFGDMSCSMLSVEGFKGFHCGSGGTASPLSAEAPPSASRARVPLCATASDTNSVPGTSAHPSVEGEIMIPFSR